MLSSELERKLGIVRAHPDKDLGILFPKESDRSSRHLMGSSSSRSVGNTRKSSKRKCMVFLLFRRTSSAILSLSVFFLLQ